MELAQCDLLTYLKNNHPNPLNPTKARSIFLGIGKALEYIHAQNISHNDIKLENILIFRNYSNMHFILLKKVGKYIYYYLWYYIKTNYINIILINIIFNLENDEAKISDFGFACST